jgi:hypothetical protein
MSTKPKMTPALAFIGSALTPEAQQELAAQLKAMNPTYTGAFAPQFMKLFVAPGNWELCALNERLTGLSKEQSLDNYVYWGVEYADLATLGQLAQGFIVNENIASEGHENDLEHVEYGKANLVLGLALEKALEVNPALREVVMRQAMKLADKAGRLPGIEKRAKSAGKFARKLHELTVMLAKALTQNQEG